MMTLYNFLLNAGVDVTDKTNQSVERLYSELANWNIKIDFNHSIDSICDDELLIISRILFFEAKRGVLPLRKEFMFIVKGLLEKKLNSEGFTKLDWDCFNDTIFNANFDGNQKDIIMEELMVLFDLLPELDCTIYKKCE